jgi:hypothetical protein
MNAKVLIVLLALVLVGAAGYLGYYLWDRNPGGPDRSDLLVAWIKDALPNSPEGVEILRQKHVKSPAIDKAREKYPGLEILDVKYKHKTPLGDTITNVCHFYVLDGKVIQNLGSYFEDLNKGKSEEDLAEFIKEMVARNKDKPPPGASQDDDDAMEGRGGPAGRRGEGPGGPPRGPGGKAAEKGKTEEKP